MPRPDLSSGPPAVSLELVEWLEAVYPEHFPDITGTDIPVLARWQGQRDIVRLLRAAVTRQASRPNSSPSTSVEIP